jgi:hypothetical protein
LFPVLQLLPGLVDAAVDAKVKAVLPWWVAEQVDTKLKDVLPALIAQQVDAPLQTLGVATRNEVRTANTKD